MLKTEYMERRIFVVYLKTFRLPGPDAETNFFYTVSRTCYDSFYPFGVFKSRRMPNFVFEPVTILYGGNGSGKSTILSTIAEKLMLKRNSPFNSSPFFPDYLKMCHGVKAAKSEIAIKNGMLLTSDDVFDYLLSIRSLNSGLDEHREKLLEEYTQRKYADFHFSSMQDYEDLKAVNSARRNTGSGYVRENQMDNVPEHSNGESALAFFTETVKENALYLLDEPENSLSPENQQKLASFLADSARFYGCQFILSTHSPFLLAIPKAKIYNLDSDPVSPAKWTELPGVRSFFDFFEAHREEFSLVGPKEKEYNEDRFSEKE